MGIVWVMLGGAVGAGLRYGLLLMLSQFPWLLVGINIAGSLAAGLLWGAFQSADWFADWGRALLITGMLGGFTTYSAFSLDALMLWQRQAWIELALYVLATVVGCLAAVWLGYRWASA